MKRFAVAAVLAAPVAILAAPVASAQDMDEVHRIITTGEAYFSVERMLDELPATGPGDTGAFETSDFGRWEDVNRNGCDSFSDTLARDLGNLWVEGDQCLDLTGDLYDPYTGRFLRIIDPDQLQQVTVDHVVSLADAWRSGASGWSKEKLTAFFNDPMNLSTVLRDTADHRAGKTIPEWIPSVDPADFARLQIRIKHKYDLSVTDEERSALALAAGIETRTGQDGDTPDAATDDQTPVETGKVGPLVDTGGQVSTNWLDRFLAFFR